MPRLTSRIFTDLAVWMMGFGLLIGVVFPPFCIALGLPAASVLSPVFLAATVSAGLAVGAANFGLARLVVGRRLRDLAAAMTTVESQLAAAVHTRDWTGCDTERCTIVVDSDDEAGAGARAFNSLVRTLARSHAVEAAHRDLSSVLSREFELGGLGAAALDCLLLHTAAEAGALLVAREEGLVPLASRGIRDPSALAAGEHIRGAVRMAGVSHLRIQAREVVLDSGPVETPANQVLVASVSFKDVLLGAIVLATSGTFERDAVELLDRFRGDLGLAMMNVVAHDRLERLAAVDPLTDAYNRRFGLARLREEYSRALRAEAPLGILMLDLDHFKAVNDTHGHLVGDAALRAVAGVCREQIRAGDVLIRYGGEEFLVVLPGACIDDVVAVGERLRLGVSRAVIHDGDDVINVTISVGAATYGSDAGTPDALITLADRAMYEAKRQGRNRTVLA